MRVKRPLPWVAGTCILRAVLGPPAATACALTLGLVVIPHVAVAAPEDAPAVQPDGNSQAAPATEAPPADPAPASAPVAPAAASAAADRPTPPPSPPREASSVPPDSASPRPATPVSETPRPPPPADWTNRTLTRAGIGVTVLGAAFGITAIGLAAAGADLDNRLNSAAYDGKTYGPSGNVYAPEEERAREELIDQGRRLNRIAIIVAIPAAVVLATGVVILVAAQPWKTAKSRRLRLRAAGHPRFVGLQMEGRF